jgi:hypothetical protein
VFANPEPDIVIIDFHGKGSIFERDPRGPEFLSAAFGELLELQGRVARVGSKQKQIAYPPAREYRRAKPDTLSKIPRWRGASRGPALEGFRSSGFMIGKGTGNAVIEAARVDSSFKLHVARLQILLVKPDVQFFPLVGRERVNGAFDLLHRV